jgi:hypothetical protein
MDTKHIVVRVPEELHRRAKVLSAQTATPLQKVLEKLLIEWAAEQEQKLSPKEKVKQGK